MEESIYLDDYDPLRIQISSLVSLVAEVFTYVPPAPESGRIESDIEIYAGRMECGGAVVAEGNTQNDNRMFRILEMFREEFRAEEDRRYYEMRGK